MQAKCVPATSWGAGCCSTERERGTFVVPALRVVAGCILLCVESVGINREDCWQKRRGREVQSGCSDLSLHVTSR